MVRMAVVVDILGVGKSPQLEVEHQVPPHVQTVTKCFLVHSGINDGYLMSELCCTQRPGHVQL